MPCAKCSGGYWECGTGTLCGAVGDPPKSLGVVYIPTGIGDTFIGIEVLAKCEKDKKGNPQPLVRLKKICPDRCPRTIT